MARSKPLSRKLMNLIGITLAVSMLLSATGFGVFEYFSVRKAMVGELASQTSVVGLAAGPTLVFSNPQDGTEVLSKFRGSKSIEKAALYTEKREWFAGYPSGLGKGAFPIASPPTRTSIHFDKGKLNYFSEIRMDGTVVGWIYIQSGMEEVRQRALDTLKVQVAILLAVFLGVLFFVFRLQESITRPIHHLAETAQAISEHEDFGLRVVVEQGGEEIETLGQSFNTMLASLEARDRRLLNHQENLEAEVAARTAEITQVNSELILAKNRAEDASRAKSAFLAGMSHELRTPLNAVLGFAQIMDRAADRSPQDRAYLEKIMKAGEHLLGLINDVLSVARIETRTLTLNPQVFDTRNFFDLIHEMIRVRSEAKGLSFDMELDPNLPPFLEGDEGKLRQVLLNLLGNAVKFTAEGGIGLQAYYPAPGGRLHVYVVDTGPGISAEELKNLFGVFVQTDSGRKTTDGSGLGLYLSQALVGLMGGEIKAESKVGSGSTFSFSIPLEPSAEAPQVEFKRGRLVLEPGQLALKQLVVDDKANNRELLMEFLQSTGFPVRPAENGVEALEVWEEWRPQVVWMDMRMPIMDGFEATRRIRTMEAERGLPRTVVLAITASVFEHDQKAVLDAGCDGMLAKPFRVNDLFESLETYAGVRFQEKQGTSPEADAHAAALDPAGVDPNWKEAFLEMLALGDTTRALEKVKSLPATSVALADYLAKCLQEFQIEEVERFFKPKESS